jgi:transcriptional regulator with GAF, ATPase, and Fis domain
MRVLGDAPLQVGRAGGEEAGLDLDDSHVSRAHASIDPRDQRDVLRDLGSRNGSFVNGVRVEQQPLEDGDVIRIGSHLLLYQALSPADCQLLFQPLPPAMPQLVGEGHRMQAVRRAVVQAARSQAPTLVLGESGVGKECVARAIHEQSGRTGSFVAVNCTALPETLAESELFGHVRGAFTGAQAASQGLFGEAEGGTLLLDEIGDMPLALQAKLLRALATGEVRAVGQTRTRQVDVHVIAATNVELRVAVDKGTFRGDLYARLTGSSVVLPPLRQRREDIRELLHHFAAQRNRQLSLGADVMEALLVHDWPFNVRELEQLVERVGIAHPGDEPLQLQLVDLAPDVAAILDARSQLSASMPAPELLGVPRDRAPNRQQLDAVLQFYGGNVAKVASFFGKERRQVYRWMEREGIEVERHR